jgi:hypothetical protein
LTASAARFRRYAFATTRKRDRSSRIVNKYTFPTPAIRNS